MPEANRLRTYFAELVVIFVGVVLAFSVDNFREARNDRAVEAQYLSAFRQDLTADLKMLQVQKVSRQNQLKNAKTLLEFYEGRPNDAAAFFEAYFPVLKELKVSPNRNTMDEVLSSGSLRLIQNGKIRSDLLNLYATYAEIAFFEEHMARDFDLYLYDPTFSSISFQFKGPWLNNPENRNAVKSLMADHRIENGLRLIVANLEELEDDSFLPLLEKAQRQAEQLLKELPKK